ncbi:hypothetical protein [Candidatus Electronema sp. PJ]|uniref:hypothetical protein n=1 Tax=Candidatus Electronema sp. PJ TaxID=3401572 RepID=UPI003AA8A86A
MPVAIRCKLEVNALTVPQSYRIRFVPNNYLGTDEIAAGMTAINPALTPDLAKSAISALIQTVQKGLINGDHINLDDSLVFTLSFTGRLDSPDDPLPPVAETLHVQIHATANFHKEIHYQADLEKRPMVEKVPVIESTEDTRLHLKDVLYDKGVLQLNGSNLLFNPELEGNECVIEGLRSGRQVQSQFGPISDSSIVLVPDIPAQNEAWQNEYTVSLSTRYTGHGTPRSGTYRRRLRSVLLINGLSHPSGIGILSSSEANLPYVSLISGTASASEMLRIQAVFDSKNNWLRLNLISMKEDGPVGEVMTITGNGSGGLSGFAGSAVSSIVINVADYTALTALVRDYYYGRLIDVLDVRV